MAYFIYSIGETDKTKIYKIAANDTDLNNHNITEAFPRETVSNEEFEYVRQGTKIPTSHDGTNFTWEDFDLSTEANNDYSFEQQSTLDQNLADKVKLIDQFLSANPSHADRDFWVSYKNTLETFDTSTVTYPLTTSWEKYCADNGITYKSILELP